MKKLAMLMTIGMLSHSAFGMYAGPLLIKKTTPGFTLPEYRQASSCEIFADRIVVKKSAADVSIEEVHPIKMRGDIFKYISDAKAGNITTELGPTDGPGTYYDAVHIYPNDGVAEVPLFHSGPRMLKNDSKAVRVLVNLMEKVCK